jgi:FAD/FMN-containing dehydrogenase
MNFKGKIFYKDNEGYEEARVGRVFNHRRPDRFPVAVFFPKDAQDVISAVKLANREGYKIAIRAGGHSWAAWSVRDEGILLDLRDLNNIKFNKKTKVAQVQPAVKGGAELNPFLREFGRFFCGGHCPTVGVGGFLLQGGQGWNARGWGWAAEYIVAIDVVTAEGELVRADATQNQDLYWAARGAGPGFFGVVTCFHLKTIALPKALYASTFLYPTDCASTVLTWWQAIHGTVSLNVEIVLLGQSVPNLPDTEGSDFPVIIVHALALEQTVEAAIEALKPFETCPVLDKAYVRRTNYETTFAEQLLLQMEANPEGHRWVVNNAWLEGAPEKITELMLPAFTTLPNAKAFSLWYSMAPLRTLPDMAFSLQTEIYFASYVAWEDEKDDELNKNWLKNIIKNIEPITKGQYLGDSDFTAHQRKFISNENYEKLEEIRAKRDPNGRFHSYLAHKEAILNQNKMDH